MSIDKKFIKSADSYLKVFDGYFKVEGGTGTVVAGSCTIPGVSVERTGTGTYTFTFKELNNFVLQNKIYKRVLSITPTLVLNSAADFTHYISAVNGVATADMTNVYSFAITLATAGTPANLAAGNGMTVHIVVKDSDLPVGQ